MTSAHRPSNSSSGKSAAAWVALPFLLVTLAAIASGRIPARVRYDQLLYHEPVVRGFLRQWPTFDFYDYLSATTPGYHLLLAVVARLFHPSTMALQIASALIGAVFVGVVAAACGVRAGVARAVAFTAPLACSLYVFSSAAWLLPDNLAWLCVTLILLISLRSAFSTRCAVVGSVILVGLVFTRQIHLWAAAPLWAAAFLRPTGGAEANLADYFRSRLATRVGRAALAVVFTVPAFILILMFVRLWGGLTPPRFQQQYGSVNAASVPFFLAVLGGLSMFFLPTLLPRLRELARNRTRLGLIAGASLVAAVIPPTNFDYYAGRRTGLWNVVQKFPVIADHTSLLVLVLAVWGGVALAAWLGGFDLRRRLVLLVALAGFWAAQAASVELWQRYVEPFALVLLAIFASTSVGGGLPVESPVGAPNAHWRRRAEVTFPLVLALGFAGLNVRSLWSAPMVSEGPPGARSPDDASETPVPTEIVVPPKAQRGLWW